MYIPLQSAVVQQHTQMQIELKLREDIYNPGSLNLEHMTVTQSQFAFIVCTVSDSLHLWKVGVFEGARFCPQQFYHQIHSCSVHGLPIDIPLVDRCENW